MSTTLGQQLAEEVGIDCPNCPNQGWWPRPNRNTGEPEQVQCEWCYTMSNSKFNVASLIDNHPRIKSLATLDTQRLDWLDKYVKGGLFDWVHFYFGGQFTGANHGAKGAFPSVREAIDAAMGRVPEPKEK